MPDLRPDLRPDPLPDPAAAPAAEPVADPPHLQQVRIAPPPGLFEACQAGFLRRFLRLTFRPLIGPPLGATGQRRVVSLLGITMPARGQLFRRWQPLPGGVAGLGCEVLTPRSLPTTAEDGPVILYLHGGAFCLGGPASHRTLCSRLAHEAGMPVWVLDYRLAPEHPYPAAIRDARAAWRHLRRPARFGAPPRQVVLAGDSAGGSLALALALWLHDQGEAGPAGLVLMSPVTDPAMSGASMQSHAERDPMIRPAWLAQGMRWYAAPGMPGAQVPPPPAGPDMPPPSVHAPLVRPLDGLPPMLVQVGEDEVLLDDSLRLARHAAAQGVAVTLEQYAGRWHVFQLQGFYLASARAALGRAGRFARACVGLPGA